MKKIITLILVLASVFALCACGKSVIIRYDGLYCYVYDSGSGGMKNNSVFRFFEDGTVIHSTIRQTDRSSDYYPMDSWFNKNFSKDHVSKYKVTSNKIEFTNNGELGSVDYWGNVFEDYLILNSHSNINGHEESDIKYVFIPFDEVPGWYD